MKPKKTQLEKNSFEANERLLLVGFLTIILLHILGGFWHSYYSWGFSYWSVLSQNVLLIVGALSILTLLATYNYRSKINLELLEMVEAFQDSKLFKIIAYTIVSILLFVLLYQFRSQSHIYGDGYLIIDKTLEIEEIFSEVKNYMEFLTVYLYYSATVVINTFHNIGTEKIIALINSMAGTFGVWALWSIANLLSSKKKKNSKFHFY